MTKTKKAAGGYQATSSFNTVNHSIKSPYVKHFNRAKLPNVIDFYMRELKKISFNGKSATALCPFHDDHHPSFSFYIDSGAFRCFSANCNAHGRGIVDFFMRRYGYDFKTAAQALNAWED